MTVGRPRGMVLGGAIALSLGSFACGDDAATGDANGGAWLVLRLGTTASDLALVDLARPDVGVEAIRLEQAFVSEHAPVVAGIQEGSVAVYSLDDASRPATLGQVPADARLHGWLPGHGALVESGNPGQRAVRVLALNGEASVLHDGLPDNGINLLSISPTAEHAIYSLNHGDTWSVQALDLTASTLSPVTILDGAAGPAVTPAWSKDGRWLVTGFSTSNDQIQGMYAWGPRQAALTQVTPPGTEYNPLHCFAEDSSLIALYTYVTGVDNGDVLVTIAPTASGVGAVHMIAQGADASPALCALDGSFIVYGGRETAVVQRLAVDGSPMAALPLEVYRYGDDALMVDDDTFIFRSAADGTSYLATVGANAVLVAPVDDIDGGFRTSRAGSCYFAQGEATLTLGARRPHAPSLGRVSEAAFPAQAALAPDDGVLVWGRGTALDWLWLDGCRSDSAPLHLNTPLEILSLEFAGWR